MNEGRAEARRAGRARARSSAWIGGIAVAAAGAFGLWAATPGPSDLRSVSWIAPAPSGEWFAVSGTARGHQRVFFVNGRTGAWIRGSAFRAPVPVISADGSTAAWASSFPGAPEPAFTPRTISLSDPRHREIAFEAKDLREPPLLVFSADSRRLAAVASDRLAVWDAASGRMLAAAAPPSPLWEHGRGFSCATFAGPDVLRVYAVRSSPPPIRESTIQILELDVPARRISATGTAGPFARTFPILADAARRRLLVRDTPASVALLDAHDGAVLRRFEGGGAVSRSAEFLSDGRFAVFEGESPTARLRIVSAGGEDEIPLGPAERAYLLGEITPGRAMLVVGSREDLAGGMGRVLVVDLGTRSVERWAERLSPAAPYASALAGDPGNTPAPGSLSTRLFFDSARRFVELTGPGRVRTLLPAR